VVVGAPRGNSTYPEHRGIHQPGVLYQCRLDQQSLCQQLVLDSGGELYQNNFNISIYRLHLSVTLHNACHRECPFILEFFIVIANVYVQHFRRIREGYRNLEKGFPVFFSRETI